jgi:hypothetical protein
MAEYEQEGRPNQELTTQGKANQLKQHDFHGESAANKSLTEHDPFYTAFWERFVEKSSVVPLGEDPAFWPANMLIEFNLLEAQRGDLTYPPKAELAEKLAPLQNSIRRMRLAYEIIAYPHCKEPGRREFIEGDLTLDRQIHERDQVALNDGEVEIIGKLCAAPRYKLHGDGSMTLQPEIPFNPQKRIYNYSEVVNNPSTEITKIPKK